MTHTRKLALLGAVLLLGACARKEAPQAGATAGAATAAPALQAAPSTPALTVEPKRPLDAKVARMMELLRAVYGDGGGGDGAMEVEMTDPEQRDAKGRFHLEPIAMHELPDGRVALVANAEAIDQNGMVLGGHSSPGLLSAYVLRRDGQAWRVEQRHENVAALGSNGRFDEVEWVSLGEGRPGFVVRHGGSWMGSTIRSLSAFDLGDGALRDLTGDGVSLYSNNEGDCTDDRPHCWSVEGKWQFEKHAGARYDDLVLRFSGHEEQRDEDAPETAERKRRAVAGMARYRFDGKRYVLIEGENIVPGV